MYWVLFYMLGLQDTCGLPTERTELHQESLEPETDAVWTLSILNLCFFACLYVMASFFSTAVHLFPRGKEHGYWQTPSFISYSSRYQRDTAFLSASGTKILAKDFISLALVRCLLLDCSTKAREWDHVILTWQLLWWTYGWGWKLNS